MGIRAGHRVRPPGGTTQTCDLIKLFIQQSCDWLQRDPAHAGLSIHATSRNRQISPRELTQAKIRNFMNERS
ncbi:hypothetical protein GCM10009662_44740 [Catellatospora coxensis]|uniref:Uncharacterized protein n=1 Tax=Catellatospora coxensis TaxID=310354 RepID=A0A8J3L0N8_9ACTN|nr:hypothetical protein Cco03nite_22900 [Catellatospora coxensis]